MKDVVDGRDMASAESCCNSPPSPSPFSRFLMKAADGQDRASAESCCDSPPSPSPLSSSSSPQWIASPSRTRDSAPRPRRSLLSAHFSASLREENHKAPQLSVAELPSSVCSDLLSKSLPSPPISAFLDLGEEDVLECSTPPHVSTTHAPPMAPRKSFRYRTGPCGKHKPRRLLFGEEDEELSAPPAEAGGGTSSQPVIDNSRGSVTPPHQPIRSFVPSKRIHVRNLR